jgi:hypothetical protein
LGEFSPIGRFFSYWAIFSYWANFFLLGEFSPIGRLFILKVFEKIVPMYTYIYGLLFSVVEVMYLFSQKMGWATFWMIFSQTRTDLI